MTADNLEPAFKGSATTTPQIVAVNIIDFLTLGEQQRLVWIDLLTDLARGGHKVLFTIHAQEAEIESLAAKQFEFLFPDEAVRNCLKTDGRYSVPHDVIRTQACSKTPSGAVDFYAGMDIGPAIGVNSFTHSKGFSMLDARTAIAIRQAVLAPVAGAVMNPSATAGFSAPAQR